MKLEEKEGGLEKAKHIFLYFIERQNNSRMAY